MTSAADQWLATVRREPRSWLVTKLHATIADCRRRGGDYAQLAASDERIVAEHRPSGPGDDAACTACVGERWPCGLIASVLAPG